MHQPSLLLAVLACLLACHESPETGRPGQPATPPAAAATPTLADTTRAVLYRSSDQGQSWTAVATNLPVDSEVSFMDKRGPQLLLATENHGIFLSNDSGQHWEPIGSPLPSPRITALYVSGDEIYAGVHQQGIYMSKDEGKNWTPLNSDLPELRVRAITKSKSALLVGTDRGIYRRPAGQTSWTAVFSECQVISLNQEAGKLVAGGVLGVLLSEDEGAHWRWIHREGAAHNTTIQEGRIVVMNISGDLFVSEDWGQAWRKLDYQPRTGSYVYELVKAGAHLVMSNNYGIHRSPDWGRSWAHTLWTEELVFIDFAVSGKTLFAGTRSWKERRGKTKG